MRSRDLTGRALFGRWVLGPSDRPVEATVNVALCTGHEWLKRYISGEEELRRWRNRAGRPLSPPQIHRKNI